MNASVFITTFTPQAFLDSKENISVSNVDFIYSKHPSNYSQAEFDFAELRDSDALVIPNKIDVPSSNEAIIHILYAMLLSKPIILYAPLSFNEDVDGFTKSVINTRLSKLIICDLTMLDERDTETLLRNTLNSTINYVLTKHQQTLIRAKLRAYFRRLLFS